MKEIQLVIFDLDGTMFDTENLACQIWKSVGLKYDIEVPDAFLQQIIGAGRTKFNQMLEIYPKIEAIVDEVKQERESLFFQMANEKGSLSKPGLEKLITYLNNHNIPYAVASSSPKPYLIKLIDSIDCEHQFKAIVGGNEVERTKPFPDVFLKCAELCNIAPEHCLVLEDSQNGIIAAKQAGMTPVFIEDLVPKNEDFSQLIAYEVSSLEEVIPLLQ